MQQGAFDALATTFTNSLKLCQKDVTQELKTGWEVNGFFSNIKKDCNIDTERFPFQNLFLLILAPIKIPSIFCHTIMAHLKANNRHFVNQLKAQKRVK